MSHLVQPYCHVPSSRAITTGIAFGVARIVCASIIENQIAVVATNAPTSVPMPTSYVIISLIALRSILVPCLEEALFRKNLNNPTVSQVIQNSLCFGLIHGMLHGTTESRATRVFLSTIGGFFYCGARIAGKDIWSSAIAHSMYNCKWMTQLFSRG